MSAPKYLNLNPNPTQMPNFLSIDIYIDSQKNNPEVKKNLYITYNSPIFDPDRLEIPSFYSDYNSLSSLSKET